MKNPKEQIYNQVEEVALILDNQYQNSSGNFKVGSYNKDDMVIEFYSIPTVEIPEFEKHFLKIGNVNFIIKKVDSEISNVKVKVV